MTLRAMLRLAPVLPMLTIRDAAHAVPLARALLQGGLPVLEITLGTPAAWEAIARITAELPQAIVGAGGVLSVKDLRRATKAGARFAVSPGLLPKLHTEAAIPLLPGAATATEVLRAFDRGLDVLGLFPAELAGGIAALKAFAGPLPGVLFCPSGGITYDNAPQYLAQPNVICVGAPWITPAKAIEDGNWDHIAFLAQEAAALRRHQ